MDAYFVRHTRKLNVRREYLERLWDEDRIAIHYPEYPGGLRDVDNGSENPDDYDGTARTAMRRLKELGERGGYVWAQSLVSNNAKVGVVESGTEIELCEAEWREPDEQGHRKAGDQAVLKTLKLGGQRVRHVPPGEAMGLRAGKPRQGTIVRWNGAGTRLASFVEGDSPAYEWSGLSTAQQEAACAEFLRSQQERRDLPKLHRLLLPVGRTLEDVDVYGLDEAEREIFAQVTHLPGDSKQALDKVEKLRRYGYDNTSLVFFCRHTIPDERDGVRFVLVECEVMDWILSDPRYARALWG